jgi:3-phosphoshikimate 1-carboxyvinyltransferase
LKLIVQPSTAPLSGTVRPPGDKSISHRAALLGGLARGTSRIDGFLLAEDTLATLDAMAALGAEVRRDGQRVEIEGRGLKSPDQAIDLGNSGTGIRLLTGALAGHPDLFGARITLVGDASLSRRPMGRVIEPLQRMGARIDSRDGCCPLVVHPRQLEGSEHRLRIASAQVKSAILLAGLNARGETGVVEPGMSRDHTERLLPAFGVQPAQNDGRISLVGPVSLRPGEVEVPGDLSSAAFLIAAALLVPDSSIEIGPVGTNPSRDGFLRVIDRMAPGQVNRSAGSGDCGAAGAEPVARLTVEAASALRGLEIPSEWVPLAIDEFPLLMALAAVAEGTTVIRGAAELRVKESDRLAVMCRQLARLGVRVEERPDGAKILGGPVHGGRVDAEGDHRIAMSLAVLGLVANGPLEIDNAEWIRTSYPGFVDDMTGLGARLEWQ